jgi:Mrp family chromosome partitioning ATPase
MPDFLDRLRDHFSWVLIDSPPLASVTDAQLLARYADLTTFVVQYNKADKKLIRRSLSRCGRSRTPCSAWSSTR